MLAIWLATAIAVPSSPSGLYEGQVLIPTATVTVTLNLRGPPADGSIDIPAQGLFRYPLARLTADQRAVRFSLAGLPGDPRFVLTPKAAELTGIYSQGGRTYPVKLTRVVPAVRIERALQGVRSELQAALTADGSPGLAYGIVIDGDRRTGALGVRDTKKRSRLTPGTPFALGALSRTFVAVTGALRLKRGPVRWTTTIADVLPAFRLAQPDGGLNATVLSLFDGSIHFAPHEVAQDALAEVDTATLLRHVGALPLGRRPVASVADWSYVVLGQLLARPPGAGDGTRAVIDGLLKPYALAFSFDPPKDRAVGHVRRGKAIVPIAERKPPFKLTRGLFGNTRDLALWLQVHIDGAILGAEEWRRLLATGAGGWTTDIRRGIRRHRTGSFGPEATIEMIWVPADRIGVVVLANRETSPMPKLVAEHLLDRLMGLAPAADLGAAVKNAVRRDASRSGARPAKPSSVPSRVKKTRPAHRLADYAGRYIHPGYGTLTVTVQGNKLRVDLGPLQGTLTHWHYETFVTAKPARQSGPRLPETPWTFITDVRGRVVAVTVPLEPEVSSLRFARTPR